MSRACATRDDMAGISSKILIFSDTTKAKAIVFICCPEDSVIGGASTSVTMQHTEVEWNRNGI